MKKKIIATILVLIMFVSIVQSDGNTVSTYVVKPFEKLVINTGIRNFDSALKDIKIGVYYDLIDKIELYDVAIDITGKNRNVIEVSPPIEGWTVGQIYYVTLEGKDYKVYKVETMPGKHKTIQGIVELPEGDRAFEDIQVNIGLVQYDNAMNYYETKVLISKGHS